MSLQSPQNWELLALVVPLVIASYLVGSFSPAYVVVRRRLGLDIRQLGNGNAGAENVSRVVGIRPAVLVAVIDIAKGLLVVLVARWLSPSSTMEHPLAGGFSGEAFRNGVIIAAGAAAVVGHSWSVYLKGAGGRGAATAVGALFGMVTIPALLVAAPAFVLLCRHRSTKSALACFFIGTVLVTALMGYLNLFGYSVWWVACAVTLPAMVGVIHFASLKRQASPAAVLPGP